MAIQQISQTKGVALRLFVVHGEEKAAADFYRDVMGAVIEHTFHHLKNGSVVAITLDFLGTRISICGANPRREQVAGLPGPKSPGVLGGTTSLLEIYVEDVDAAVITAVQRGATVRTPAETAHWGDRVATIVDPFGHIWALASVIHEVSVDDYNASKNGKIVRADSPS